MPETTTNDRAGTFDLELATGHMTWSPMVYELHGLTPETDEPTLTRVVSSMCPEDREPACSQFLHGARTGGAFTVRYGMLDPTGRRHELVVAADGSRRGGVGAHIDGFVIDVTGPLTEHMNEAVASARAHQAAIEQAKGAVMLALRVPEDRAFQALRRLSNTHNVRLSALAERLVENVPDARPDASPVQALMGLLEGLDPSAPGGPRRGSVSGRT